MRRSVILFLGVVATGAAISTTAQAQFPLDPRALIGRMTAPLRHMLPHPRAHHRPASRDSREAAAGPRDLDREETGKLGVVGPRTWPTAYEDVIGYTFWPQDFEAAFRQHGFADITTSIITPADNARPAEARAARPKETTGAASDTNAAPNCGEKTDAQSDWPKADIEKTVKLDDTQRNALDRLQATVNNASKSVRNAMCGEAAARTPLGRLEALLQRLWAVQNATVVIRGPLKNFYDTLNDEQKAKFRVAAKAETNTARPEQKNAPVGRAGACAQNDDRLMKAINQTVRPDEQQKKSTELLGKTAGGMGQYLMASCAQPTPEDPLARLDAVNGHLTAINYAATSMEVALNQFASSLSDEQRKKFDAMGR